MTSSDTASYVMSPGLDQAETVASLIRAADPNRQIVGVLMPGEKKPRRHKAFATFIPVGALEPGARPIPTGAQSARYLLERGDVLLGSVIMTAAALRFFDKPWSIAAAAAAGVPVPRTWTSRDDIDDFPVFYKSTQEGAGAGGIARSRADIPDSRDGTLIFQELIDTPGTLGIAFVADAGIVRTAYGHFEAESCPETGGSAIIIEPSEDARLLLYAERLLKATSFSGWGLIEFKYCSRRRDLVFMELNAKLWASCDFTFRNEPRFPQLLFALDTDEQQVQRMVFFHRALARGPSYVVRNLRRLFSGTTVRYSAGQAFAPFMISLTPIPLLDALRLIRSAWRRRRSSRPC